MRRPPNRKSISRQEQLDAVEQLLAGRSLSDVAHQLIVTQRLLQKETDLLLKIAKEKRQRPKAWVFLSHAHEDAKLAVDLADYIEDCLGPELAVFCTSRAQHRIEAKQGEMADFGEVLEEALGDRLQNSAGVLLLITANAVTKHSRWIEFEIDASTRKIEEQSEAELPGKLEEPLSSFWFMPCVTGDMELLTEMERYLERTIFRVEDTTNIELITRRRTLLKYRAVNLSDTRRLREFIFLFGKALNIDIERRVIRVLPPNWLHQYFT